MVSKKDALLCPIGSALAKSTVFDTQLCNLKLPALRYRTALIDAVKGSVSAGHTGKILIIIDGIGKMKQGYPSYPMIKNGMLTEGPFVYFQKAYANTQ